MLPDEHYPKFDDAKTKVAKTIVDAQKVWEQLGGVPKTSSLKPSCDAVATAIKTNIVKLRAEETKLDYVRSFKLTPDDQDMTCANARELLAHATAAIVSAFETTQKGKAVIKIAQETGDLQ